MWRNAHLSRSSRAHQVNCSGQRLARLFFACHIVADESYGAFPHGAHEAVGPWWREDRQRRFLSIEPLWAGIGVNMDRADKIASRPGKARQAP